MKPNHRGFTIVEIIVVMVLVGIIATMAFTRSITTDKLNLVSRADKFQAHIRYAQSMAQKTNDVWGIYCNGSQYWLFNGSLRVASRHRAIPFLNCRLSLARQNPR